MTDPTRPTPGRRPSSGVLVVILSALMLVNLTTLGLLVVGGGVVTDDDAADDATPTPLALTHSDGDGTVRHVDPVQTQGRPPVINEAATPAPQALAQHPADEIDRLPPATDARDDRLKPVPTTPPQVADHTPRPTPAPATDPEPTTPPIHFFGLPIFE